MRIRTLLITAVLVTPAFAASIFEADARRGADLFATQMCLRCHSINRQGGSVGPDLGRRMDRDYTPALLASLMWNHAPATWKASSAAMIQLPPLTEAQASDLFAYFYSVRYFEKTIVRPSSTMVIAFSWNSPRRS